MMMATRFAVALFVISPLLSVDRVQAADYPNKPIRWVLGFAPGGAPDNIARVVGLRSIITAGQGRSDKPCHILFVLIDGAFSPELQQS